MKRIVKNQQEKQTKYIKKNTDVREDEIEQLGNDKKVFVSIKNLQNNFECFSDWSKAEMNKFWSFNQQIHNMTWKDIYATASKGKGKRGLAYTVIEHSKYENISFMKRLSKDITFFELRVDDEIRVHGFRDCSIFHLCVLDKNHKITK
ncbi:MAG6450 family protein [uncultured Bacteroides sp.]|uniref:MAG6450 family protein n=1 Tax=uncultured Bacteroides sp. TaxID=162156 RepID=UPI00258C02A0|nr:hypothetical protein [uncultured Bacteroides sp.]